MEGLNALQEGQFSKENGASGSWARPYFSSCMRCKRSFKNSPGILCPAGSNLEAENGILMRVQSNIKNIISKMWIYR